MINNAHDRYLGDGLYASFDGYQIWLAANHPENKTVAIDPHVFQALLLYGFDVFGKTNDPEGANL